MYQKDKPPIDSEFSKAPWKGGHGQVTGHLHSCTHGYDSELFEQTCVDVCFEIDTGSPAVMLMDMQFVRVLSAFCSHDDVPLIDKAYQWAVEQLGVGNSLFTPVGPEDDELETISGKIGRHGLWRSGSLAMRLCLGPRDCNKRIFQIPTLYATFSDKFADEGDPWPYSLLGRGVLNNINQMLWKPSGNHRIEMSVIAACARCRRA